jgi:hypothetical protein
MMQPKETETFLSGLPPVLWREGTAKRSDPRVGEVLDFFRAEQDLLKRGSVRGRPNKCVVAVGVNALARETGLAKSTVSSMMRRGVSPEKIRAEAAIRRGDLKPASKKKAAPEQPEEGEYELLLQRRDRVDALEEMKFRRAKALAERQEIENMLRRGELLPTAYARKWGMRFLIDGRDELLKGPSELADSLAAETDPLNVAEILRAWLERAMDKFEQLRMLWEDNQSDSLEENRGVSSNNQLAVLHAEARS